MWPVDVHTPIDRRDQEDIGCIGGGSAMDDIGYADRDEWRIAWGA